MSLDLSGCVSCPLWSHAAIFLQFPPRQHLKHQFRGERPRQQHNCTFARAGPCSPGPHGLHAQGTCPACHPQAHTSIRDPLGQPEQRNGVTRSVPALPPAPTVMCTWRGEMNPYSLEKETEKLKSEFKSLSVLLKAHDINRWKVMLAVQITQQSGVKYLC